ncbi:hypothetical protein [Serratia entomophila]|uniref:Uncharacterized protein n=1 Tax=Serratia entomophila TaxID=42906 RepID=A0ABY5CP69_9GAMM|nr:hypothetical protein [Serratia entomophila]USU99489.1 hypothetical protein KFQ06_15680 [Serratia entomophila]
MIFNHTAFSALIQDVRFSLKAAPNAADQSDKPASAAAGENGEKRVEGKQQSQFNNDLTSYLGKYPTIDYRLQHH